MEIKDVVEHKVLSVYQSKYLSCVDDPKERLNKLVEFYKMAVISLELLKIERDNKHNSDSKYFDYQYFPLFSLNISNVEDFSKFILGEKVNKILIKRKEIEEGIEEVDEEGTTYENRQLYFNAYSNELTVNSILRQRDILRLVKERKLFLFGEPLVEVVTKKADIPYSNNSNNNVFTLREDENNKGSYPFRSYYLDHFKRYYKDIVGMLRYSLSDEEIDLAKEKLREMDFGILEESFRRTKENCIKKELLYDGLERESSFYKKDKTLAR